MKLKSTYTLSMMALSAVLAGCGSGGAGSGVGSVGGNAGSGGAVPGVQQAIQIFDVLKTISGPSQAAGTPLVMNVAGPTYVKGSEDLFAFNKLNVERGACGFGLLSQNAQLDVSARGHSDYQIINNTLSHDQNRSQFPNGFTGNTSRDRASAAGYSDAGDVGDNFTMQLGSSKKATFGDRGMRELLNAPYHVASLLAGYKDVGIAVRSSAETTPAGVNPAVVLQVATAFKNSAGKQLMATGDVATYPCAGTTNVNRKLNDELPNPVPGRNLKTDPIGSTIYIAVRDGQSLSITSATMVETASKMSIKLRTPITRSNDPNNMYKSHEGYVAPDAPLKAFTQHSVDIRGTNNGTAFVRQFTFTTGS